MTRSILFALIGITFWGFCVERFQGAGAPLQAVRQAYSALTTPAVVYPNH